MNVLSEEAKLQEIVQLVGSDALPEDQQLTLEVARMLREYFLQQNAFHDVDTYCEIGNQAMMMETILHYKELAEKALAEGIEFDNIVGLDVIENIGRAKFEKDLDKLMKKYSKELDEEFEKIRGGK